MNAVVVRAEIFSERFEQFGIRRLNGPGLRRWILGIQSHQIETVVGLDQADDHQLLPQDVDRRSSELDVIRHNSRQRLTWIFARPGFLSSEQECGLVGFPIARETTFGRRVEEAVVAGVVSGRQVIEQTAAPIEIARAAIAVSDVAHLSEKRGLLPEVGSLPAAKE